MSLAPRASTWAPSMLAILRIVVALLFLQHTTQKLFGFPPTSNTMLLSVSFVWVGIPEFIGSLLTLLGLLTRPVALIFSVEMAVAYWKFYMTNSISSILSGGKTAAIYSLVFLYLAFSGPGMCSFDGVRD